MVIALSACGGDDSGNRSGRADTNQSVGSANPGGDVTNGGVYGAGSSGNGSATNSDRNSGSDTDGRTGANGSIDGDGMINDAENAVDDAAKGVGDGAKDLINGAENAVDDMTGGNNANNNR